MRKRSEATMNDPARTLLTPEELAGRYAVAKSTVLDWFHTGKIPAEVAIGKIIRFCPERVAEALAREAPKGRRPEREREELGGMVRVI